LLEVRVGEGLVQPARNLSLGESKGHAGEVEKEFAAVCGPDECRKMILPL
jgi:hypothetical protein